jgi:bacterial/archaeal transporter family-2 protein
MESDTGRTMMQDRLILQQRRKKVSFIYLVVIAAIGGVAVALQAQLMGNIDKHVGTLESVFVTYGGGGFIIGIIMILLRGGNLSGLSQIPWYTLLSGPMGLVLIAAIGFSVPRLGLVPAFTILVAAQFVTAAVIDQFGLFGADIRQITLSRVTGILVILLGIWLAMR